MDARDPRGLAGSWADHQDHVSGAVPPDLAPWIERAWGVSWRDDEPFAQLIVPLPQVHLTVANDAPPLVTGVCTGHRVTVLRGEGRVAGVAFQPGVFSAVLGGSVAAITDTTVPALDLFPGLPTGAGVGIDDLIAHLRTALPAPDDAGQAARHAVATIRATPTTRRVDDLAASLGTSVRSLQRLFADHVGVGPKWAIRRNRLQEVTERMSTRHRVDWAALVAELGYADQAHFTRDFTGIFGEPPTAYAARY